MNPFLIVLSVSGFITLKIYNYRTKNYHQHTDGWLLIFNTLWIGLVNQILPLLISSYLFSTSTFSFDFNYFFVPAVLSIKSMSIHLIFTLLSSVFFGYLFSTQCAQKLINQMKTKLTVDENPKNPLGSIAEGLNGLVNKRVMLNLKSGKVYVGRLVDIDVNERALYENRGVEIFPIKSGFRDDQKNVQYTTLYIFPKSNDKVIPKNIHIKLGEIETFAEFDQELEFQFKERQIEFIKEKDESLSIKADPEML